MNEIKAFVGHSFSADDSVVVGKFTGYLAQLAGLVPNFSWQHAEPAEPETLDKKVLRIIADKNTFIGICTIKECAVQPATPIRKILNLLKLKPDTPCDLKTSDWIIQEIGLAVGRGMRLILLVEEGLRKPGGLQGDLEYIPFKRHEPEKAFGKILEMIKALKTQDSLPAIAGPGPEKEDDQETAAKPKEVSWLVPAPTWNRRQYEFAFMHHTASGDAAKAQEIESNYFATDDGKDAKNMQAFKAFEEYIKLYFNKGGQLKTLKEMAVANPQNSDVLKQLAKTLKNFEDHAQAATVFKQAADVAEGMEKLNLLSSAATEYQAANDKVKSEQVIQELKGLAKGNSDAEIIVINTIGEMAKEEDELQLAIMERKVELNPSSGNDRFQLGYKHSQNDNQKLALMHYLRIDEDERDAMTWNNLGVSFDLFKMPAKAVTAYRQSVDDDTTLAMSNLANKLSRAGFLDEAQALCDRALKIPDYEKNVLDSLSRLKDIPTEEDAKEKEVVEAAVPLSRFYARAGEAVGRSLAGPLDGRWIGKTYPLDIKTSGKEFLAGGSQTVATSPGLGALFGGTSEAITYKHSFVGEIHGAAISGKATQSRSGGARASSILMSGDEESLFLILVSPDGNELEIMEKSKDGPTKFLSFVREIPPRRQIAAS